MNIQMAFQKFIFLFFLAFFPYILFSQKFGFNKALENSPQANIPFSLENTPENLRFLQEEGVKIKRITENWLFFTHTPGWINKQKKEGKINSFYFEYAPPELLSDSARAKHFTDSVHLSTAPLNDMYTGKGVILGFVDSGLDYDHPDLIDEYGNKRVIRYWDQSETAPTVSPQPYDYGQIYYHADIQQGPNTTTSESDLLHGTTVVGMAAGNGLANGRNKGMAPEAEIIFVETDFSKPNWTLTVADACDFIFAVADSLGKPAVINLSVGSSLGSHDGTDPAGELMSLLVREKRGRIIIGAAGNSGDRPPFHAQNIISSDTSFIWFKNNPNGTLGENTVFFDLWSDINDAQFKYSFGANRNNSAYEDVGSTAYRFAQLNVGTPIFDTLYNVHGDRIATIEIYTEYQANNFHLQGFFSKVDSTDYLLRFSTTGVGKYDLWSGKEMGLNDIVRDIPTAAEYPPIVNYVMPDSAQSLVSSWNCSPDIISVANIRNRYRYLDPDGNYYYHADNTTPGDVAKSSSRGPSRAGVIKPDIAAAGEMSLSSAPLFVVNDPAYNPNLDEGGYHMRNNGTSMASPVVAGIAALYLERCPNSSIDEFKADLFATAYSDNFTGTVPNNRVGYGKINAFDLVVEKNGNLKILGDTAICQMPVSLFSNIPLNSYNWSNGSTQSNAIISQPDTVSLYGNDLQGCKIYSDTVIVIQGSPLENPSITFDGTQLISSEAPNYQWYRNDSPISGATQQTYTPTTPAYYSVAIQGPDNCKSFSTAYNWTLGLDEEQEISKTKIYPNPAQTFIYVEGESLTGVEIISTTGQTLKKEKSSSNLHQLSVEHLARGLYYIKVQSNQNITIFSFFKE